MRISEGRAEGPEGIRPIKRSTFAEPEAILPSLLSAMRDDVVAVRTEYNSQVQRDAREFTNHLRDRHESAPREVRRIILGISETFPQWEPVIFGRILPGMEDRIQLVTTIPVMEASSESISKYTLDTGEGYIKNSSYHRDNFILETGALNVRVAKSPDHSKSYRIVLETVPAGDEDGNPISDPYFDRYQRDWTIVERDFSKFIAGEGSDDYGPQLGGFTLLWSEREPKPIPDLDMMAN